MSFSGVLRFAHSLVVDFLMPAGLKIATTKFRIERVFVEVLVPKDAKNCAQRYLALG